MSSRRFSLSALVLTLFGLIAGLLVTAPAQATSTIICKGFTGCANAGLSSFGYGPTNYRSMWWRMYSGHNCTNYVAYRMIKAGMSSTRPWSGSGDARNWGVVFKDRTNQTPLVGSVAWWSSNHVAYVQKVVDANTIIISEDHYGGDFDWRRIVRSGGGWPTGFIHLVDEAVKPTAPPSVVGNPQVDQTLSTTPGSWNQTGLTYGYQWKANGAAILGATNPTYTPTPAQVGNTFTVRVTASKTGYRRGASTSPVTAPAAPGVMTATVAPTITGIAKVGAVLTATPATWDPQPDSTGWAWFADGKYISGGSGPTLTLTAGELGKVIRVVARGFKAGYSDAGAPSAATEPVGPEKLTVEQEPRLIGNPHTGREFRVDAGVVNPSTVTTSYQWLADDVAIPGATGPSYTPTLADPGKRLTVRISYSKPGYTTVVRELRAKQAVRSYARIYVRSLTHRTVTVTIQADGVPVVRGEVVLISRTGARRTVALDDGRATFSPEWLYAGTRPLTISYLGSFRVEARSRSAVVEVR